MAGMALTELGLSHFRSHLTARLVLDGRPVVLYGPNGAGKTNLLEAVSLMSPGRGLRRAATSELARRPEAMGWKLDAALVSGFTAHEVETRAGPSGARQVRLDGKAVAQVALGRITRILWLVPAMDRLWTEAAEGRRRFLDRMSLSFAPGHAQAVLDYEKAMRQRNRLLKEGNTDARWHAALEAQMARAGATIEAGRRAAVDRIAAAQAAAETAFPVAELTLEAPEEAAVAPGAAALRAALSAGRGRDMAAGRTLVGPHRTDLGAVWRARGVAAREASTGEQKALLISLVLANARALAQDVGAPPILLLDEVAAHLDADRRAALYHEITALGAQAWLTGTGAELFAGLDGRAQHFQVTETDGLSHVEEVLP